jgi:hypothetical protein
MFRYPHNSSRVNDFLGKAYFGHGGVNGLQEAIHFRKPIVAMPLWADGEDNVNRLVRRGAAIRVDKNSNADQGHITIFFQIILQNQATELKLIHIGQG